KQLCEDMARYLYLARLRDDDILLGAIHDGLERLTWHSETFAYAEGWDEQRRRYKGLRAGQPVRVVVDAESLVVKQDVAAMQIDEDRQQQAARSQQPATGAAVADSVSVIDNGATHVGSNVAPGATVAAPPKLNRFHGSVRMDPLRLG